MSDTNLLQQQFDNYAKEFSLRIELLRALGQWHKDKAEADLTEAQAAHEWERTKTTYQINQALRRTLQEIEQAEHRARVEEETTRRRVLQLELLITGIRPQGLSTYFASWSALAWMISQGGDPSLGFQLLRPEHREPGNFLAMSPTNPVERISEDQATNLLHLITWMRFKLLYFHPGSAVHQLFAETAARLTAVKDQLAARLQARLDQAQKESYDKLHELRNFLGFKAE